RSVPDLRRREEDLGLRWNVLAALPDVVHFTNDRPTPSNDEPTPDGIPARQKPTSEGLVDDRDRVRPGAVCGRERAPHNHGGAHGPEIVSRHRVHVAAPAGQQRRAVDAHGTHSAYGPAE